MRCWAKKSDEKGFKFSYTKRTLGAFTLIELLVVVAVIALLLSILFPALSVAKKKALSLRNMVNQRNIAQCLNTYANDNADRYPHSIATAGNDPRWTWADPRLIVSYRDSYWPRQPIGGYRSLSGYMADYISDADTLHCPCSPDDYPYLDQVWEQGDNWNHTETPLPLDPMTGSYCFWWGYKGWLPEKYKVFKGPWRSSGGVGQSTILVSDYFGSDTWRNPGKYGSCESASGESVTSHRAVSANFWVGGSVLGAPPKIKLRAAYTDGHCGTYTPDQVGTLDISQRYDGTVPFPTSVGKGKFYLPLNALP